MKEIQTAERMPVADELLISDPKRLQEALSAAKTGVWERNFLTGRTTIDSNIKSLLGYSSEEAPDEFEQWNQLTLYPPDAAIWEAALADHMEGRIPIYECTFRRIHRNGSLRWFFSRGRLERDSQGNPRRLIGTATDISELKETQESLRESEERFGQIAAHCVDLIWMIEAQTGKVLYANPAFERIWGYSVALLLDGSRRWFDAVVPEDREMLKAVDLTQRTVPWEDDYRVVRSDGSIRTVHSHAYPILREGRPYRVAGVAQDVTESRLIDEKRMASQREHSEVLLREVHHRIKNNLQGVTGLLSLRMHEHPEVAEILTEAKNQVETVALVHGIQSTLGETDVSVERMTKSIVDLAVRWANAPIQYTFSRTTNRQHRVVQTQSVSIALALNELLTNAIKHSSASTSVPITVHLEEGGMNVQWVFSNPGMLPDTFDFRSGVNLGTGLNLVRSMLPSRGANVRFRNSDNVVTVELELSFPNLGDTTP